MIWEFTSYVLVSNSREYGFMKEGWEVPKTDWLSNIMRVLINGKEGNEIER